MMEKFSSRLRKRAEVLGITSAEVARRLGLSERRYSNYVTGNREPDLAMLTRIAKILGTTPNELLGVFNTEQSPSKKSELLERLNNAARTLRLIELEVLSVQVEALATRRTRKSMRTDQKS
jgi:transcriptional regulator with XRE-family HTH domain